jgi:LuxR family maltose regulon positive regulatory protein
VSSPFILVLDDYHLISVPLIHQQLAFLLEHQPPQMHLVIITREDPPWPLARLRARGQVVEIRQADLLHHRLQVESRYDMAPLHNRACRWFAENGLPPDAIRHALAASNWEEAASLLQSHGGDMLRRGEVVTLLGWYRALPEEFVRARPQLCYEYSWPLLLVEQIDAAESFLSLAEQAAQGDAAFLGEIAAARAHAARVRGDGRRVIELSEKALALLPPDDWSARSIVALNLGLAYWYAGYLTRSEQVLAQAQQAAQRSGNDYVGLAAQVFMSKILAARGRLRRAVTSYREAIQQGGQLPLVALAHSDLAKLLYEQNDLQAAADQAQQAMEASQRSGSPELQLAALRTWALIKQAQGESAAAQHALQESLRLVQHPGISPTARLHTLAFHILIALADDDPDQASRLIEQSPQLDDKSLPDYVLLSLARVRLLLIKDRRAEAVELLKQRYETVTRAGFESAVFETRVLQALAAETSKEALAFLTEAVTQAEPEGYVRTLVDLGEPLVPLLKEAAQRGIKPEYVGQILTAMRGGQQVIPLPSSLVEPLSERELAVLRLVAAGLSNREIAEKLIVSPGTAKSHVNHICGKLGARNRTEAVTRAKELGLV